MILVDILFMDMEQILRLRRNFLCLMRLQVQQRQLQIIQRGKNSEQMEHGERLSQIQMVLIFHWITHHFKIGLIMKNLKDINEHLLKLPTIISIDDEIFLIQSLMVLSKDEITSNKTLFLEIIKAIELSHTVNGFMEITKDNEYIFIEFSDWLSRLKKSCVQNIQMGTLENFSLTLEEIQNMMG